MTLHEALIAIHEENSLQAFPEDWRESPFVSEPDDLSLDPDAVTFNAKHCLFPSDRMEKMLQAAEAARANPAVVLVAKMIFRAVFLRKQQLMGRPWVSFEQALGPLGNALNLVIASAFYPIVRRWHVKYGISESVSDLTCGQVNSYCDNFLRGHGVIGIYPNQFSWLHCYVDEHFCYLRLGRFEFRLKNSFLPAHVFRKNDTGNIIVFSGAEMNMDADGFALGDDSSDPRRVFTTEYEENDLFVRGNTVDREGRTSSEPVRIEKNLYTSVLSPEIPILDMHIPAGGGMSPLEVEKSLRAAKDFFTNFPDVSRRPKVIICASWIFNPNLPEILPGHSNLNLFLRRVHPVPIPSSPEDGLWFIFLFDDKFDLRTAPRTSSLQKAVCRFIENGGRWRHGGMFLPMDEI